MVSRNRAGVIYYSFIKAVGIFLSKIRRDKLMPFSLELDQKLYSITPLPSICFLQSLLGPLLAG